MFGVVILTGVIFSGHVSLSLGMNLTLETFYLLNQPRY